MGVKRSLDFQELVVDGDMSSDVNSPSTNIQNMDRCAYQAVWTGSPTGEFKVDISNDDTNWVELTLSTPITASGSGDIALIDIETAAKYVRLRYVSTSGTGTLNAHIVAKSISG